MISHDNITQLWESERKLNVMRKSVYSLKEQNDQKLKTIINSFISRDEHEERIQAINESNIRNTELICKNFNMEIESLQLQIEEKEENYMNALLCNNEYQIEFSKIKSLHDNKVNAIKTSLRQDFANLQKK